MDEVSQVPKGLSILVDVRVANAKAATEALKTIEPGRMQSYEKPAEKAAEAAAKADAAKAAADAAAAKNILKKHLIFSPFQFKVRATLRTRPMSQSVYVAPFPVRPNRFLAHKVHYKNCVGGDPRNPPSPLRSAIPLT